MKNAICIILIISLFSVAQADDIKIACLGNSITSYKGTYPHNIDPNSYPVQLRVLMNEGYDIINFGVSGRTLLKNGDYPIWDEVAFSDALAFEPDIVTILLGTNDSKPQNWVYKDEFVPDYIAMIDTFRSLPSNPEIYTCLPPPAFSSKYDISDSVIVNDILPMIQQVADDENTTIIDFYTHFLDKAHLSYDGIHPTIDGLWEYVKVIYDTLTHNTVEEIEEVNLALHKAVLTPVSSEIPDYLVDGEAKTIWTCWVDGSVTIDLGEVGSIDMFQIVMTAPVSFDYTIETSEDDANWTTMVDASNPDTSQVVIASVDPVNARWIRFTLNLSNQPVPIAELRVLETAPIHAPVMTYQVTKVASNYTRYNFKITSCIEGGYIKHIYADSANGIYEFGMGYQLMDTYEDPEVLMEGKEKYYIAKFFKDYYEVASDTLHIDHSIAETGIYEKTPSLPNRFALHQNYPNPFNPSTVIRYHLPIPGKVKLVVYDCLGKEIDVLVNHFQGTGDHSVQFHSHHLPSGIYFYRLETNNHQMVQKMVLIR